MIFFKGFRFGLILQFSIGPVCSYLIITAISSGIILAESGVIGATIADCIFVSLAILGVGTLLKNKNIKFILKYAGALILFYFGIGLILSEVNIDIIPTLQKTNENFNETNIFMTSFILTLSSPLSILFWTGIFSTKMVNENYKYKEMFLFGSGAVFATLFFLGILIFFVGLLGLFIPAILVSILNILVGIIIIIYGIILTRKEL